MPLAQAVERRQLLQAYEDLFKKQTTVIENRMAAIDEELENLWRQSQDGAGRNAALVTLTDERKTLDDLLNSQKSFLKEIKSLTKQKSTPDSVWALLETLNQQTINRLKEFEWDMDYLNGSLQARDPSATQGLKKVQTDLQNLKDTLQFESVRLGAKLEKHLKFDARDMTHEMERLAAHYFKLQAELEQAALAEVPAGFRGEKTEVYRTSQAPESLSQIPRTRDAIVNDLRDNLELVYLQAHGERGRAVLSQGHHDVVRTLSSILLAGPAGLILILMLCNKLWPALMHSQNAPVLPTIGIALFVIAGGVSGVGGAYHGTEKILHLAYDIPRTRQALDAYFKRLGVPRDKRRQWLQNMLAETTCATQLLPQRPSVIMAPPVRVTATDVGATEQLRADVSTTQNNAAESLDGDDAARDTTTQSTQAKASRR